MLNADLAVANNAVLTVRNGLELDGVLTVGTAGNYANVNFAGTQTLSGTGQVVLTSHYWNWPAYYGSFLNVNGTGAVPAVLTVGSGITIHGPGLINNNGYGSLVNQGIIRADAAASYADRLAVDTPLTNDGTLSAINGGNLYVNNSLNIGNGGKFVGQGSGSINIRANLLGDTTTANQYAPSAYVCLDGSGTAASPQLVEVMSADLGPIASAFRYNLAYDTLLLGNGNYVKLVDQSTNSTVAGGEALYANTLIIPAGSTLDLNGLHVYARTIQQNGQVLNGAITLIPDGGPISYSTATSGSIAAISELDEWTFFGRPGRSVNVTINPGSGGTDPAIAPFLGFAFVQLLDPSNNVLGTAQGSSNGQVVSLSGIELPEVGTYRIQVRAANGHGGSTGNYTVSVSEVIGSVNPAQPPDLAVTTLSVEPVSILAGDRVTITYVVSNNRTGPTPDRWLDSFFLSHDNRLDAGDLVLGRQVHEGSLLPGQTSPSTAELTVLLPAGFTLGDAFIIAKTDASSDVSESDEANNTATAPINLGIDLHTLILNEPAAGSLGPDQAVYYQIEAVEGQPLEFRLDVLGTGNTVEMYIAKDRIPTRSKYDIAGKQPFSSWQYQYLPRASAGTYYVLLYGAAVASAPASYSLAASVRDFSVRPEVYGSGGNAGERTVEIHGSALGLVTAISLTSGAGLDLPATAVFDPGDGNTLFATFDLRGVAPGQYSVRVASGTASVVVPNSLTVVEGQPGKVELGVSVPSALGVGQSGLVTVTYCNTGLTDVVAPVILVEGTGADMSWLTTGQSAGTSAQFLAISDRGPAGVLAPGASGSITFRFIPTGTSYQFTAQQLDLRARKQIT